MLKSILTLITLIVLFCQSSLFAAELTPLIQVESLIEAKNWEEVDNIIDTLSFKNPTTISFKEPTKREKLESQIKKVRSFWEAINHCIELESTSSSRKSIKCYKKVLRYNWEYNPQEVAFSEEFISKLESQRNTILLRIKQIHEEALKPKRERVEAYLRAYNRCVDIGQDSSAPLNEQLDCYNEAQAKRKDLPRNFHFSRRERVEIH